MTEPHDPATGSPDSHCEQSPSDSSSAAPPSEELSTLSPENDENDEPSSDASQDDEKKKDDGVDFIPVILISIISALLLALFLTPEIAKNLVLRYPPCGIPDKVFIQAGFSHPPLFHQFTPPTTCSYSFLYTDDSPPMSIDVGFLKEKNKGKDGEKNKGKDAEYDWILPHFQWLVKINHTSFTISMSNKWLNMVGSNDLFIYAIGAVDGEKDHFIKFASLLFKD